MYPTRVECVGIISKKQNNATGRLSYLIFIPLLNINAYGSITLTNAIIQGIRFIDTTTISLDRKSQQGLIYSFANDDILDFSGYIVDCTLDLSM